MSEQVADVPVVTSDSVENLAVPPVKENLKLDQYNHQNPRPVIPEGMSKSQWKKQQRRLRLEESKATFQQVRKEKKLQRRANRRAKIEEYKAKGEEIPAELLNNRNKKPENQTHNGGTIIMDCAFDDLMNEKEIISLSNQITRAYSSIKLAPVTSTLKITSFNKTLKERFDKVLIKSGYNNWKNIEFEEEEFEVDNPEKFLYFTADSNEILKELDPSVTYIIGGIVDKNRHKNLCKEKAESLGIKTARLPITEFIKLSGRTVLTTGHVIEIMLKWYEFKDWKKAFEAVLPSRKMLEEEKSEEPEEEKYEEPEEETKEEDKE